MGSDGSSRSGRRAHCGAGCSIYIWQHPSMHDSIELFLQWQHLSLYDCISPRIDRSIYGSVYAWQHLFSYVWHHLLTHCSINLSICGSTLPTAVIIYVWQRISMDASRYGSIYLWKHSSIYSSYIYARQNLAIYSWQHLSVYGSMFICSSIYPWMASSTYVKQHWSIYGSTYLYIYIYM